MVTVWVEEKNKIILMQVKTLHGTQLKFVDFAQLST